MSREEAFDCSSCYECRWIDATTVRDFQGEEETEESQCDKGMGRDSAAKRMDGCGFDEALGPRNLVEVHKS